MKPSNFTRHPWNSVMQECGHEVVAQNIMVILKKTGNTFRELSWDEYKKARIRDGSFCEGSEKYCFNRVTKYCKSPDTASLFCKDWYKPDGQEE